VVDGPEDVQSFSTTAALTPVWLFRRDGDDDLALIRTALEAWQAPAGDGYVWIAAEAQVARALRDHMLEERRHPKAWLKAAGYWVRGAAGASDKLEG
jgi:NADPH-dependent ferric siderophore reductase